MGFTAGDVLNERVPVEVDTFWVLRGSRRSVKTTGDGSGVLSFDSPSVLQ